MDRPLRVAVTLEQCWHRVPGGTATSALGLVAALQAESGVEVVGASAWHRHPPAAAFVPSVPVRAVRLPYVALYDSWHRLRWPRLERTVGLVDVVHATGVAVPPCRVPLVVTVHDLAFLRFPEHATRRGQRFFRLALDRTRRHADLVLCPSAATADDCAAAGIEEARIRVIPWGVASVPMSEAEVQATRRRFRLPERFVLFVGTIEPRKNLPRLLEAWRGVEGDSEVPLVLVGPGGWNEDVGPAVRALGDRVRLLGFVDPDELRALYAAATVFCYPSLFEGFGLPVLEAMAQGTPVVTSAGTATAEVVGDVGMLVDPLSVDAIRQALECLLLDPVAARDLGRRGKQRAAGYTWSRTARSTLAAYREVART